MATANMMLTPEMQEGIKEAFAVVLAETTGQTTESCLEFLKTVNTAEDFFGTNVQGLKEYNNFIAGKENEYNQARKRALAIR